MIKLRSEIEFEPRAVSLTRIYSEPRQVHCTFQAVSFLRRINIKPLPPHRIGLRRQGDNQRREKLITRCHPLRAGNVLVIIWPRRMLSHSEQTAALTEPTDVDAFGPAVDRPDQTGVAWIIIAMNRRG